MRRVPASGPASVARVVTTIADEAVASVNVESNAWTTNVSSRLARAQNAVPMDVAVRAATAAVEKRVCPVRASILRATEKYAGATAATVHAGNVRMAESASTRSASARSKRTQTAIMSTTTATE